VKDPEFRTQFNKMCTAIGVDPLACTAYFVIFLRSVFEVIERDIDQCSK
jgi:hypothetical protein